MGESARLPPLWPWFGSRILRHMWFEFVVGSGHCSEGLRCPRLSQSPFLWESSGAENGLFAPAARQISTDQILGRRCVRGCGGNYLQSETVLSFDVIFLETRSSDYPPSRNQNECARRQKLRVKYLNFENIRENQRKVVEAYLSGRDVLMISPAGSGKSLTFHIAPFAIDSSDDIQTVCLVIFPLVSLMNDQVPSFRR